jgi:excisionase family DNA binding protein
MTPLLLTIRQAAELIGVSRPTLSGLMDRGDVFSIHIGASRRIPLWAVYDYLNRLCGRTQILRPVITDLVRRTSEVDHLPSAARDSR